MELKIISKYNQVLQPTNWHKPTQPSVVLAKIHFCLLHIVVHIHYLKNNSKL